MLILPDRLVRYTGVEVLEENNNLIGRLSYSIPLNMKKLTNRASWHVSNLGYLSKYKEGNSCIISEEVDNYPQEYEFVGKNYHYRNPSWFVKTSDLIVSLDDDSFSDAIQLGLSNKKFNCSFVWIYDGGKMRLVAKDSDIYNVAKQEQTTRKLKPIKSSNLEFGGIYEDLQGNQRLYLGIQTLVIDRWQNGTTVKEHLTDVVYIHAGFRRDNKIYNSLKDIQFSYHTKDFVPRRLITKLNITTQDVKNHCTTIGRSMEFV